ncbi:MAG: hypothetical protein WAM66_08360 [Acidobacteriaceae bacterium]
MSMGNLMGSMGQLAGAATNPGLEPGPRYDLRPLSTGEVLDRTFHLYRSRFALFAGLALLPAAVSTVTGTLRLTLLAHQNVHVHAGSGLYWAQISSGVLLIVAGLISIVLYGITQAATTWALSAVYLGEAASIKAAYKVAFQHWFRYTMVVLRQVWAGMWLPFTLFVAAILVSILAKRHGGGLTWLIVLLFVLAFLSVIYGVWAYLRVSLAVPAAVVESLKVRASVRRSAHLLANRKVRIFLLFLLLFALYTVVGTMESPLLILAVRSRGTEAFVTRAIQLAVNFVAATLIAPVGAIGVCLFYFDERVRREGFDIEWMMRRVAPVDAVGAEPTTSAQESSAEPA